MQFQNYGAGAITQLEGVAPFNSDIAHQWIHRNASQSIGYRSSTNSQDAKYANELGSDSVLRQPDPYASPFASQRESFRLESQNFEKRVVRTVNQTVFRGINLPLQEILQFVMPVTAYNGAGTGIRFTEVTYGAGFADIAPQLGVARSLTQRYKSWQTNLQHVTLGILYMHADLMEEDGNENWMNKLIQFNIGLTNTWALFGWYALVTAALADFTPERLLCATQGGQLTTEQIIMGEQRQWAFLMKKENAFAQLMAYVSSRASAQNCDVNCLIVPKRLAQAYKWTHAGDEMSFVNAGPRGPQMAKDVNAGPVQEQTAGRLKVIELPVMAGPDNEPAHDFTLSLRAIGEGFRFTMRDVMDNYSPAQYKAGMKIQVYSYDGDQRGVILVSNMIKCSGLFDEDGALTPLGVFMFGEDPTFGDYLARYLVLDYFKRVWDAKDEKERKIAHLKYRRVKNRGPTDAKDYDIEPFQTKQESLTGDYIALVQNQRNLSSIALPFVRAVVKLVQTEGQYAARLFRACSQLNLAILIAQNEMDAAGVKPDTKTGIADAKVGRTADQITAMDAKKRVPFFQFILQAYAPLLESDVVDLLQYDSANDLFAHISSLPEVRAGVGTRVADPDVKLDDFDKAAGEVKALGDDDDLIQSILNTNVTNLSRQFFEFLDEVGLPLGIDFILSRNNIVWTMHNMMAVDTRGLGAVLVKEPLVETMDDGQRQYGMATAHINAGAVVYQSQNIIWIPNVLPGKFQPQYGGGGISLYDPNFDRANYVEGKMKTYDEAKDIFVMVKHPTDPMPKMWDLRGYWDDNGRASQVNENKLHFKTAPAYTRLWNWDELATRGDLAWNYNGTYPDDLPLNTVCIQSTFCLYDFDTGTFNNKVIRGPGWFTSAKPADGLLAYMEGEYGEVIPRD
jgi:hypothetical protein